MRFPRSGDMLELQVRVKCGRRLSSARPEKPIRGLGKSRRKRRAHLHPSGFAENDRILSNRKKKKKKTYAGNFNLGSVWFLFKKTASLKTPCCCCYRKIINDKLVWWRLRRRNSQHQDINSFPITEDPQPTTATSQFFFLIMKDKCFLSFSSYI